jgi:hypothetical protein
MIRYSFIKPLKRRHIFLKNNENISIFIMYNPHHIYNDNDYLLGYLLLLDKNMKIPYITGVEDNIEKRYKLDYIKDIYKIVSIINNKKYNIYYVNCNSKYYNSIFDNIKTELIWKDFYFINGKSAPLIEYKINDIIISNYDILNKLKELFFYI